MGLIELLLISGAGLILFWYGSYRVFRWLLAKGKMNIADKMFTGILMSTGLTFFVAIEMFPRAVLYLITYEKQYRFSRERWCADPSRRYLMRKHIMKSGLLHMKSKQEIQTLLDPPTWRNDSLQRWIYDLGMGSAGFGVSFHSLIVTFKNDTVNKAELGEVFD